MKDFFGSALLSLEALFLQFNYRRLLFWLFIVIVLVVGFISAEKLTGYFFFFKLEQKTALLTKLNELSDEGISNKPELAPIYDSLVSELNSYKVSKYNLPDFSAVFVATTDPLVLVGKFLSGGLIGFWAFFSSIIATLRRKKTRTFILAGLIFGIFFGLIGLVTPTIYFPWVNIIFYPILQFVILIFIISLDKRKATNSEYVYSESDES